MKKKCKACGSLDLSRLRRNFFERLLYKMKFSCYDCRAILRVKRNEKNKKLIHEMIKKRLG